MLIREAVESDLAAVMAIVAEVVEDMATAGNPQWNRSYPDEDRFAMDIEDHALYVAVEDGGVIGFVSLDQEQSPTYEWMEWTRPGPYLVMHRMAVSRAGRGRGVAGKMESFAVDLAGEMGCDHIRVDTNSRNEPMKGFLIARGYRYVGQMRMRGIGAPFVCYEKLL